MKADTFLRWVLIGTLSTLSADLSAQESFSVDLADDGKTIGDMRPVFLPYRAQAMPAISPREVARRYQRLFDESGEPKVRIDALNRLANLHTIAGSELDLNAEQEQRLYHGAIESYEMVVSSGSFQGRLDELLYQYAKAYAFVGQGTESIERLKQLVGLYPRSELAPEARFRIAESAFANGQHSEAEMGYRQVLTGAAGQDLKSKARYMLGWSQYKQGAFDSAGESFIITLDDYADQSGGFAMVPPGSVDVVEDTFRIVAIMSAETDGADALKALLERIGPRPYDYLLYDRLADHYAARGQYADSVAVAKTFLDMAPNDTTAPAFRAQIVDVWGLAGLPDKARRARAEYVAAYEAAASFRALGAVYQQRWLDYAQALADYHYYSASNNAASQSKASFAQAAGYYEMLATRQAEYGPTLRLAGDAWLQSGRADAALIAFEKAGFSAPAFEHSADAAWAAVSLRFKLLNRSDDTDQLTALAAVADRFASTYPADPRIPAMQVDIAHRMSTSGGLSEAVRFATAALDHPSLIASDAFSAWLVLGDIRQRESAYRSAEQAWRKALTIGSDSALGVSNADELAGIRAQLATSIYRQGESAERRGVIDQAVAHFQRVELVSPASEVAIKGRYDAATLLLKAGLWQRAITELQRFRADYGDHSLADDIREKLVLAYESSEQPLRAAHELTAVAHPSWPDRLRAAELYHQAGALDDRNVLYVDYLSERVTVTSAAEHLGQQRMRKRLITSGHQDENLREQMIDHELASEWHSEASLQWASDAALDLGEQLVTAFQAIELTLPLSASLASKRQTLDAARARYRQAEQLGGREVRSESLFQRAELYRILARDIAASSRPHGLNELELAQYALLLDEQAYPFEEKSIELHAENHQQIADGVYNRWVEKSLGVLGQLFPGRYARDSRWIAWQQESKDDA
ncbi:hypothetical protein [Marinobacter caseinilyticus]|uniref:hypothetical protein n=1 Tax=Marinobacter caseinilyticus TaxID=2692195 RepID=UPI00140CD8D3|nr:hypothetical protein [Marinobacter caseinilyticus]